MKHKQTGQENVPHPGAFEAAVLENSPVPIWEEDFSAVKSFFSELKEQGITDIDTYFGQHPDALQHCAESARIINVNQAALTLHGAESREELLAGLIQTFTPESFDAFRRELVCLWNGDTQMSTDAVVKTLAGEPRNVTVYFSVCAGHEETFSRVIVSLMDITERKQAEEALSASEAELRTLIKAMTDVAFVNSAEGRYLKVVDTSPSSLLYKPPKDLEGKTLHEVFPKEQADFFLRHIRQALDTQESVNFEYSLPIGEEVFWFYATSSPMGDGRVLTVARDISELKRAQDVAAREQARLQFIFDALPIGISLRRVHRDGSETRMINDAHLRIVGIRRDQDERKTWERISHPGDRERQMFLINQLDEGKINQFTMDKRYIQPDGRIVWVMFSVQRRKLDGGGYEDLCTVVDITGRKQAEDAIRTLNQQLEDRVAQRTMQLEAANKELESFCYSVSHDLRAPLRHIDGFMELLNQSISSNLDEKSCHYMTTIMDAAKRMGMLIDDLLALSRTGRQALSRTTVDLREMAREVVGDFKHETADRTISWDFHDLPVVSADRTLMRAVLENLVSNAIKFTRPRAVAEIEIDSYEQEGETIIFIRDNGVGFDMKYADKLFGVFQRLHRSDEFEGTGIGLANVQRIITRHGGRTWAEAAVDKGAIFYFSLPRASGKEAPA